MCKTLNTIYWTRTL